MEGPTAGGDAPVIEATKTDRIDDSLSQSTIVIKPAQVDIASENVVACAEENRVTSSEVNAEASSPAERVVDSGTGTADTNAKDPKKDATAAICQPAAAQSPSEEKVRAVRFKRNQIMRELQFQIVIHPVSRL